MMLAVRESKKHLPPDYKPDPDGEFKANVINSVVFLVSAVQQVSVFVVNLKGPPFMSGLTENSPLLYSLACTFVLTFLLASETIPQLNKFLQLVPFPTPAFRSFVLTLLAADIGCSFLWDRLMTFIFAPRVLKASMEVSQCGFGLGFGMGVGLGGGLGVLGWIGSPTCIKFKLQQTPTKHRT